jgi:hypothetical protein
MHKQVTIDPEKVAGAINRLSTFVAQKQISSVQQVNTFLQSLPTNLERSNSTGLTTDVIVICVSSVLSVADTVFSALSNHADAEKISRWVELN